MQDAEVDITQLGDGCPQSVCESRCSERVGTGRVDVIEWNAVVLASRTQGPLASPEAVELFIEYARIDNEHPIRPTDSVEQRSASVPMGFAIKDG